MAKIQIEIRDDARISDMDAIVKEIEALKSANKNIVSVKVLDVWGVEKE